MAALSLVAATGAAAADSKRDECNEVKAEIREIRAKMRAGYTRAQGEKYEEKLRKLRRERRRVCR